MAKKSDKLDKIKEITIETACLIGKANSGHNIQIVIRGIKDVKMTEETNPDPDNNGIIPKRKKEAIIEYIGPAELYCYERGED